MPPHPQPTGTHAAGEDPAVIAQDTILARAAINYVMATPADQIIILPIAEQLVAAGHAVDEIVASFSVDLVASTLVGRDQLTCGDTARCESDSTGNRSGLRKSSGLENANGRCFDVRPDHRHLGDRADRQS